MKYQPAETRLFSDQRNQSSTISGLLLRKRKYVEWKVLAENLLSPTRR